MSPLECWCHREERLQSIVCRSCLPSLTLTSREQSAVRCWFLALIFLAFQVFAVGERKIPIHFCDTMGTVALIHHNRLVDGVVDVLLKLPGTEVFFWLFLFCHRRFSSRPPQREIVLV